MNLSNNMNEITNGEIDRLGAAIADKNGDISDSELELLQTFRVSFSKPLSQTFNEIRDLTYKIRKDSITACRLKRIGTILNKIPRQPKMKLSRMGDIAGIRCIFNNEKELYKAVTLIKDNYQSAGKMRDYIKYPKPLGYKGIHLYIRDKETNKRIEVQLRTLEHHNWATLVEITDLLYDLRLKELGFESNENFAKFHSLISSDRDLTKPEADLIYNTLHDYKFISKLSSTFRKNNDEVKKRWMANDKNNSFFLIEASKDKIPLLKSFKTFEEAEDAYFERYKFNPDSEMVLTSIRNPNFRQISVAYANYILAYHTFINDIRPILTELAKEAIEDKEFSKFFKIFKTYEELIANVVLDILADTVDVLVNRYGEDKVLLKSFKKMSKSQQKEITRKVNVKLRDINITHKRFIRELENNSPKNFFWSWLVRRFLKRHNKRVVKIFSEKHVEMNELIKYP